MDIPVLILTGGRDERGGLKGRLSFADSYLQKPSDLTHLGDLIKCLEETRFNRKA